MDLRVGLITTWAVRCGIASYSENLGTALSKLGADVYVMRVPRFGRKDNDLMQNIAERAPADIVDLFHVQHEYGIFQSLENAFFSTLRLKGKPIITTMHSVGAWEVDKIVAEFSDRVIVHNEFCFRRFNFPKKTGIIPHGATPLETDPPLREECKKSLGIDSKIPLVGYVGFISTYKGLETLIEAMVNVPGAALLIGGGWHVERETEYITRLKEWTGKDLQGRCLWLGFVPDKSLGRVYGAMDLVVYPSRFSTESGALIMALSHEKAVIASNVAPFKEKEKASALMTFTDAKNLARKITRLLKDEESRRKLEEGAKTYVRETSWNNVAAKHIDLYREVLGKN